MGWSFVTEEGKQRIAEREQRLAEKNERVRKAVTHNADGTISFWIRHRDCEYYFGRLMRGDIVSIAGTDYEVTQVKHFMESGNGSILTIGDVRVTAKASQ